MNEEERIEKYVDETEEKLIKTKLEIEAEEYEKKQGYKGLLDALYEEGQNKGYECVRSYITPYIVRAYIESAMVREKRIAELEKENAELKAFKEKCKFNVSDICKEIETENNLTKAKEIIKKLIEAIHIWDCKNLEEVEAEAKQFLKEE